MRRRKPDHNSTSNTFSIKSGYFSFGSAANRGRGKKWCVGCAAKKRCTDFRWVPPVMYARICKDCEAAGIPYPSQEEAKRLKAELLMRP